MDIFVDSRTFAAKFRFRNKMKTILLSIISIIISISFSSCVSTSAIESDIYSLKRRITTLEEEHDKLSKRIHDLCVEKYKIQKIIDSKDTEIKVLSDEIRVLNNKISKLQNDGFNQRNSTNVSKRNNYTPTVDTYTGRCQAITKKGTQCKRTAVSGSRYCWQHNK